MYRFLSRAGGGRPLRASPDRYVSEHLESRLLLSTGWDIALIDKNLPGEAVLERAMKPGGRVILYDSENESAHEVLSRVVEWVDQSGGAIRSLSLLAHASAGRFELGNQWISKTSVDEIAADLETLGKAMASDGSINLYGCSLADPLGDGQILMDRVSSLARARVFASSDVTGRGGDWTLEAASVREGEATGPVNPFSTKVLAQWPFSLAGAGFTVTPNSGLVTTESGGTATFTIVLKSSPGLLSTVSIGLSSNNVNEGTVSPSSITFNGLNWNVPQTVTVTGVDDAGVDGNVGYKIITASAVSGDGSYDGKNVPDVSVTNADNDTANIFVSPSSGLATTETGGTDTFSVFLGSKPSANVTVPISSSNTGEGTVSVASLTFTPANWATPQTVTVSGIDDLVADGDLAYSVITGAAVSSDSDYHGFNASDVSVTNTDNDSAGIIVSPTSGLVTTETGSSASFTVVLASRPTADVSIGITSSNTAEGTVSASSLSFTAANWNAPQTITVMGVDDFVVDGNVNYNIITAAASSADLTYNTQNASNVSVSNTDNDTAGIAVSPTSGLVTTEAGGTATFTVALTSQPTANVSIGISSSNTAEGTCSVSSLSFTAGNWNIPQTVIVTGADDVVDDGNILYSIVTAAAVSADPNYSGRSLADVSVSNTDDETAGITVSPTSGLVTTEAGGTANFTVVLTSKPGASVTIPISSSNTAEGTVSSSSLTFTTANWNVAQTITLNGVNDFVDDGDIAYTVVTAAATSADANYSGMNAGDVAANNADDDTAGVTVVPTSGLVTTEAGGTAGFTVVLDSKPTANVAVGLSSSNTAEGTVSLASITFTAANWNVAQAITVTGVNDFVDDGDIGYSIVTAAASSADALYNAINAADVSVTNSDDDSAGITVAPTSGLITTEAGGAANFTVVLNSRPTKDVTIGLSSSNSGEGGLSISSVTFTSANWSTPQNISINGVDDAIDDGDIAYSIVTAAAISGDLTYSGLNAADISVTNTDDDTAGISVSPTSGLITTEAGGTASFTLVLSSRPVADVTIPISSSNSAEGTVSTASVTFTNANWNTPQTVTITGANDVAQDGDVAYSVVTGAATSADLEYDGLDALDVSLSNHDNDTTGFILSPTSGLTTTEAGGTATFTIVLTALPAADVTLPLSSSNSAEGTVSAGSILFTPANWNLPQTVTLTGVNDPINDGDIAYTIVSGAATSADANYNGINPADVSVTNIDDDIAGITVNPTLGLVTTEAGGAANFTVVLNSKPTGDVVIGLSSSNLNEGVGSASSLTFTAGNWNIPQTVSVTGVDDLIDDGDVSYSMVTAAASSSDLTYNGINAADVALVNTDNDTAGITVSPTSGLVTTEAGGAATFTIVLNTQPTADVTVPISSNNTSEGTVAPSGVIFTSANWNTPQTVTVTGVDDMVNDGDIGYTIVTGAASSGDANYNGINPANVSATNHDNDIAGITVAPTSGLVTTEAGGTDTFTVVLNSQPTASVTVPLSSSNLSEGGISAASLIFTTANWNTPQTVTVSGVDESINDGNTAFVIVTGAVTSADSKYDGVDPANVSVTNTDDDSAGITVTPTSGLTTTEAGGTAQFSIVLNSQPGANVSLSLSSSNTAEGLIAPASVSFTTANWSTPQVITITGVDDLVHDGDANYSIITAPATSTDPRYSGRNAADVTVTNTDDDSYGITLTPTSGLVTTEAGATATFTIVLNSQPTAGVTIPVSSSNSAEGILSVSSLTFTAANWDIAQTITVTGVNDFIDDGAIAYSVITAPATSSDSNYSGFNPGDVSLVNSDDDTAGFDVTPTTGLFTSESGGEATFTVRLNSQPTANVSVLLSSDDIGEGTVSPASLVFTAANWNTPQTVTVSGVDDDIADGDLSYGVVTSSSSSDPIYAGIDPADVSLINADDDLAGVTVMPIDGLHTTESGGVAAFSVVLDSQPTADVSIPITSGDASEAAVSTGSITFTAANWYLPQTITVTGVDDVVRDDDIAFAIITGAATSADASYNGLNANDVAGVNSDDDVAEVIASPTTGHTTTESGGTASFTIVLTSQPISSVTVPISSSDLTEGTLSRSSVTFDSANWAIPQSITITGVDDATQDGNIAYSILSAAAVSADPFYSGINAADVAVTNTDNDVAGITVMPTSGLTTSESGDFASFSVVLDTPPTANVRIFVTSGNAGEGALSTARLTFSPANWNVPQSVTVTDVDDSLIDGDQAYAVTLSPAISGDPHYDSIDPADVTLVNEDDDVAAVLITPSSGLITRESGATAGFNVVLQSQPAADVVIGLVSSNTGEGILLTSTLTFTSANWNMPQQVMVAGIDDAVIDNDVAYTVSAIASSADANYDGVSIADVSLVNVDNDDIGITVLPVAGLVTTETGGSVAFDILLAKQPAASVTVTLGTSNTAEGIVSRTSLTFTVDNWDVARRITVSGVNDLIADGDVQYDLIALVSASADTDYAALPSKHLTLTNDDDDAAGFIISSTGQTNSSEAGGIATFDVLLSSQPTADVVLRLHSVDRTEGKPTAASLTFTPTNWNVPQTLGVRGVDDFIDDGDIAYRVLVEPNAGTADATYAALPGQSVSLTNLDNDTVGLIVVTPRHRLITSENGSESIIRYALTSQPASNVWVTIESANSSEGSISISRLVFTPSTWNVPQSLAVRGMDDDIVDGDISYQIIAFTTSADTHYQNAGSVAVDAVNLDNDIAAVIISPVSSDYSSATFSVRLASLPASEVLIALTVTDANGTISTPQLRFSAGDWNQNQNVTVVFAGRIGDESGSINAAASSDDSQYNQKQTSQVLSTLKAADIPRVPPLSRLYKSARASFDLELPRAAEHEPPVRFSKPARAAQASCVFVGSSPAANANGIADLREAAEGDDAPEPAPDEPPIPEDSDPAPLDPEEEMLFPEMEITMADNSTDPVPDASLPSIWRTFWARAILPFLPLCQSGNRSAARRTQKQRERLHRQKKAESPRANSADSAN
jgi:hypothetical protein